MPAKNYIEVDSYDSWHISIHWELMLLLWSAEHSMPVIASRLQQERRRCWYWFRDLFEGKTCKHRGLPGHSIIVPAGHATRQGTLMVLIDFPTGTRVFQKTIKRRCKKQSLLQLLCKAKEEQAIGNAYQILSVVVVRQWLEHQRRLQVDGLVYQSSSIWRISRDSFETWDAKNYALLMLLKSLERLKSIKRFVWNKAFVCICWVLNPTSATKIVWVYRSLQWLSKCWPHHSLASVSGLQHMSTCKAASHTNIYCSEAAWVIAAFL